MSVDFAGMVAATAEAFGVPVMLIMDRQEQGTAAQPTLDPVTGQRRRAVDRYDAVANVLPAAPGMGSGGEGGRMPMGERRYVIATDGLPRVLRAGDEVREYRTENGTRIDTVVGRVVDVEQQVGGLVMLVRCVQDRAGAPSVMGR